MLNRYKITLIFSTLLCIVFSLFFFQACAENAREFTCEKTYLNFPVKYGGEQRHLEFFVDGQKVREMLMALSDSEKPDFWVYLELKEFQGKTATLTIDELPDNTAKGFSAIYQDDTFPGEENLYKEKLRPQLHFSSKRGWNNDPNGMVYYDGEYHLFYQHNPYGWPWGNMTWGHNVSKDMIHWEELGDAIHLDELGTIFSGGAVVDHNNSSGFQTGDEKPIVCFYTSAGSENPWSESQPFTQSMAYSNDRGRTFTKYEGNPIIGHIRGGNRDPKVIWHDPTQKWIMVLYVEEDEMDFFTSTDLKNWTKTSRLEGFHECPELFELSVDGDMKNMKWVTYGAGSGYHIGSFDGNTFKPDAESIRFNFGKNFYASQTFSDIPKEDGRRIMMGWGQVPMLGMPFNQQMSFPIELSLKTTDEGIRMYSKPVREIENLHKKKHSFKNKIINDSESLKDIDGELFHIKAEFDVGKADYFGLVIREFQIYYDVKENQLICKAPENNIDLNQFSEEFNDMVKEEAGDFLEFNPIKTSVKPLNGKLKLEIIVDRTYVEVFVNGGRYYIPVGAYLTDRDPAIMAFSKGGKTTLNILEVYELNSIWN
jgi:sucrose-6-phosphate hydrolase SacC (GH32 family)